MATPPPGNLIAPEARIAGMADSANAWLGRPPPVLVAVEVVDRHAGVGPLVVETARLRQNRGRGGLADLVGLAADGRGVDLAAGGAGAVHRVLVRLRLGRDE